MFQYSTNLQSSSQFSSLHYTVNHPMIIAFQGQWIITFINYLRHSVFCCSLSDRFIYCTPTHPLVYSSSPIDKTNLYLHWCMTRRAEAGLYTDTPLITVYWSLWEHFITLWSFCAFSRDKLAQWSHKTFFLTNQTVYYLSPAPFNSHMHTDPKATEMQFLSFKTMCKVHLNMF